ncbi:BZ3500_MvSof-1268-A1-R1_Chr11-1g03213 [Microbotryum saponariae]|uniref:BZ3500_MvSof-1268-A1-R1_Chr11-1g03213 protein n=1 Tax=Microbotryum saponariae TaxID=289078 RepID=A0A2X0LWH1_9BASI|nr:BZ3501_MvSof-1269-A2-R1_Chr11g02788 [Microbotryum saponariae]SDA03773.1 BZ3500_MvSof-1268-A1-R1_Chr11-1g03213 [Microbotryum saponariae]
MVKWIDRWYNLLHPTPKTNAPTRAGESDRGHRATTPPSSLPARTSSTPVTVARVGFAAAPSSSDPILRLPVRRASSITLYIRPKRDARDSEANSFVETPTAARDSRGDCDATPTIRTLGGDDDDDPDWQPRHSESVTACGSGDKADENGQGGKILSSEHNPFHGLQIKPETPNTRADVISSRGGLTISRLGRPSSSKKTDCSASSSPAVSRPSSLRAWSSITESPSDEDQKPSPSSSVRIAPIGAVEESSLATVELSKTPSASLEASNKSLRRWSLHFSASSWKTGRPLARPPPPPPPSPSIAGPTISALRGQIMGSEFLFDAISKPTMTLRPRSLSSKSALKMKTKRRKKVFGVGDGDSSDNASSSGQDDDKVQQTKELALETRQLGASTETQRLPASRCSSPPSTLSTQASSLTLCDESLESRDYFDDFGASSTGIHGINVLMNQRTEGEPLRRHSDDYSRYYRAPVARYFAPIATEFPPCHASDGASSATLPRRSHTPPFSRACVSRHQSLSSATQLRPPLSLTLPTESTDRSSPPWSRHRSVTVSFADATSLPSPTSISSAFSDSNQSFDPPKSPSSLYKMKRTQYRATRRRTQSTGSNGSRGPLPAGHPQLPLLCARIGFARRSVTSDSEGSTSSNSLERSIFGLGDGEPTPIVESVYVAKAWSIDTEFAAGSGGENDGFESGSIGRKSGTTLQIINPDDASSGSSTPILSPHPSPLGLATESTVPNPLSSSSSSNVSSSSSTPKTTPTPTPNLTSSTPTRGISYFPTPSPPLSALSHRTSKERLEASTTSSIPFPTSPLHHQAVGIAV